MLGRVLFVKCNESGISRQLPLATYQYLIQGVHVMKYIDIDLAGTVIGVGAASLDMYYVRNTDVDAVMGLVSESALPNVDSELIPNFLCRLCLQSNEDITEYSGFVSEIQGHGNGDHNGEVRLPNGTWMDAGQIGSITLVGTASGSGTVTLPVNTASVTYNGNGEYYGNGNVEFAAQQRVPVFESRSTFNRILNIHRRVDVERFISEPHSIVLLYNGNVRLTSTLRIQIAWEAKVLPNYLENSQPPPPGPETQ